MRRTRLKSVTHGLIAAGVIALAGVPAVALDAAPDIAKERVIDLKDGGRLELRADGTMGHYDTAGIPVPMKDGEIMIAAGGTRIMMKSEALWREIVERAAISYGLAFTLPSRGNAADKRSIELADGGRVALQDDGTMAHFDVAGHRVDMEDGAVMTAKGGARILMKNGTLWSALVDRGPSPSGR